MIKLLFSESESMSGTSLVFALTRCENRCERRSNHNVLRRMPLGSYIELWLSMLENIRCICEGGVVAER